MAMDDKAGRLYVCNYGRASISIIDSKDQQDYQKNSHRCNLPTNLIIVKTVIHFCFA